MPLSGTILNVVTILIGTLLGMLIGNRLPKRIQESVITGIGSVTLIVAIDNALKTGNIIVPLLSLVIGVIIGEVLDVDGAIKRFGGWLQSRVSAQNSDILSADAGIQERLRFINGFVTASLIFCVGPMAIMGSIKNGINAGDVQILAIKSTLDFFTAIAFSASLGIGVAFSIIPTIAIQGVFTLMGIVLGSALVNSAGALTLNASNPYIREFTATGGLILIGIALTLLEIKQPRVSNFLPALIIAPLLVWITTLLGISIYPL